MSRVEVLPIQKAVLKFIENGGSWSHICSELGWMQTETKPESSRLQRCLGLRKISTGNNSHGKRYSYNTKRITYDNAVKIIEAIGREPRDFEL